MPVREYLKHELVGDFNRAIVEAAIKTTGVRNSWMDGYDDPPNESFTGRTTSSILSSSGTCLPACAIVPVRDKSQNFDVRAYKSS